MFFETTPRYTQTFAAMTSERMRHTRFSASSSTRWAKSSLSTLIQEYLRRLRATIPSSKNQFRDLQTYTQKGHTDIKNTKETTHQPSNLVPPPPQKKKVNLKKKHAKCSIPCQEKNTPNIQPTNHPESPQAKVTQPTGWPSKFSKSSRCKHLRGRTNTGRPLRWILPRKKTSTQKKTYKNNRWMWSFHSLVPKIKQMYVTYIYMFNPPKKKSEDKMTLCFWNIFLPSHVGQFSRKLPQTCKSRDGRRTHSGCQTFPWLCGFAEGEWRKWLKHKSCNT